MSSVRGHLVDSSLKIGKPMQKNSVEIDLENPDYAIGYLEGSGGVVGVELAVRALIMMKDAREALRKIAAPCPNAVDYKQPPCGVCSACIASAALSRKRFDELLGKRRKEDVSVG